MTGQRDGGGFFADEPVALEGYPQTLFAATGPARTLSQRRIFSSFCFPHEG
jgi:hypothetical protein